MLGIARCIHYLYERIKSNGRAPVFSFGQRHAVPENMKYKR